VNQRTEATRASPKASGTRAREWLFDEVDVGPLATPAAPVVAAPFVPRDVSEFPSVPLAGATTSGVEGTSNELPELGADE
jgi:hypothetical protein